MHTKDFIGWNALKQNLSSRENKSVPRIKEREVWWCSIGVNVGCEVDGHNELYNRPVLIVRKFSPQSFWGVPLTTKSKTNEYNLPIEFKGVTSHAMLSQSRLYDTKRIQNQKSLMGTLPDEQFDAVKRALKKLLKL
jgi:mRNA interferase MazF